MLIDVFAKYINYIQHMIFKFHFCLKLLSVLAVRISLLLFASRLLLIQVYTRSSTPHWFVVVVLPLFCRFAVLFIDLFTVKFFQTLSHVCIRLCNHNATVSFVCSQLL